ncbi:MAG: CRISPR-associated helicase Cas3' [Epsilonproteobacteria bacterium]|nr:hypothetical protein [Campylobacterota bacterium]NPA56159.1 CRISPR-associated helicase Cas3' [Campylobacterota bacterium]
MAGDLTFYSHRDPFLLLRDHLDDVGRRCLQLYRTQQEFISLPIDEVFLKNIGRSHDFGKYTSFFQSYLLEGRRDRQKRHHHSFLSALFGAWLVEREGSGKDYLPLIAYSVIKHHHGDLSNFDRDLDARLIDGSAFRDQIGDLQKRREAVEADFGVEIGGFLSDYRALWKELRRQKFLLLEKEPHERRREGYLTILYTYSLLIDSDKHSASHLKAPKRLSLPSDLLEHYRKIRGWEDPKKPIDHLRTELYREVQREGASLKTPPPITTITAPTGLGKTFLNLSVALRYRHLLPHRPRIIYSLPFISIIDQTYRTYDEILDLVIGDEYRRDRSRYLIEHHHLSTISYRSQGEELPVDHSLLLIESWESEIVVTTFVQLLHSIIAFKNSFLKKFHNIVGSILILDEVQNIDPAWWKVVGEVLEWLTQFLGVRVLISTATRPFIFSNSRELVPNPGRYFAKPELARTVLLPDLQRCKDLGEFGDYLLQRIEHSSLSSHLIVLNTIATSIDLYRRLREGLGEGWRLFYLSTNVIPLQRRERIASIGRAIEKGEKVVVVSTQVIETGVDLDFQCVYRDLAPLDSIVQVAGRCNRNGSRQLGEVEIHRLWDPERGREYGKMIYGSSAIEVTHQLLGARERISAEEYRELIQEYFTLIGEKKSSEPSDRVLGAIEGLRFDGEEGFSIAKDFRLIEELPFYTDLFIEIDEKAREVYRRFEEIMEERDFVSRLRGYREIKGKLASYIISVPRGLAQNAVSLSTLPKIPLENIDLFYESDGIGLKREGDGEYFVF